MFGQSHAMAVVSAKGNLRHFLMSVKTNKKLILFDENRQIVDERQEIFAEISDEDGFPCDDLERLTRWVQTSWADLRRDARYSLKGINFTAYGCEFRASWRRWKTGFAAL